MKINVNEITKTIRDSLENYSNNVTNAMEKSADKTAKKGAKALRGIPIKRYGRYREGWTKKKEENAHIVHNKDRYQLAHLIEDGYTLRNGKRKEGRAHIKPVEKEMIKDYEKDVKKAIQDG